MKEEFILKEKLLTKLFLEGVDSEIIDFLKDHLIEENSRLEIIEKTFKIDIEVNGVAVLKVFQGPIMNPRMAIYIPIKLLVENKIFISDFLLDKGLLPLL